MYWYESLRADKLSEGETISLKQQSYLMKNGVLRAQDIYSPEQKQTEETFGFKWKKRSTYESADFEKNVLKWLLERYVENRPEDLNNWIPQGARVLDAGCGGGMSASLLFKDVLKEIHYLGVDISEAAEVAKQRFAERGLKGEFLQANLLNLPFSEPTFDVIFSEGVLHHTDSTERALKYLAGLLRQNGYFMFYVYRKKGPLREYADDVIREYIRPMSDEMAWQALEPLTKLGKVLGDANVEIDVPEDIPFLGIPKGKIDLQRFIYWYFCKAYYKPEYSIDEMNHINFDWYRPSNCQRHTEEELVQWCNEAGMDICRMKVEEAGITVIARKK